MGALLRDAVGPFSICLSFQRGGWGATFYPIALRKTEIVYNFGLSECNRVKKKNVSLLGVYLFFYFSVDLIFEGLLQTEEKRKVTKIVSLCKICRKRFRCF